MLPPLVFMGRLLSAPWVYQEGWPDPTELPHKLKKGHGSPGQLSLPRTAEQAQTNRPFWIPAEPRMKTGNAVAGQGVTADQCAENGSNETAREQVDIM